MQPREAVRWVLGELNKESLQRLCELRDEKKGGKKAELMRRLESSYGEEFDELVEDLRNWEKQELATAWAEADGTFFLSHVVRGRAEQLEELLHLLMIDDWVPSGAYETPISGAPFLATAQVDLDGQLDNDAVGEVGRSTPSDASWIGIAFSEPDVGDDPGDETSELVFPEYELIDPATAPGPDQRPDAQLASFQVDALSALDRHFERHNEGLLCLPTGGGKTRTSVEWLLTRFVARGQRVLWITHRVGLLDQVHEELRGLAWLLRPHGSQLSISRYQGPCSRTAGDFVLASTATLVSRMPTLRSMSESATKPVGIICFDEAHRAVARQTWRAIQKLRNGGSLPLLGLTATPFRRDDVGTAKLLSLFGERPAYQASFKELVKMGFLARPFFVRQRLTSTDHLELNPSEIAQAKREGDVPPSVLGALARNEQRTREIVTHWCEKRTEYGKTIAFACDIEHSERLASHFRKGGVSAAALHSKLDGVMRIRLLQQFRNDDIEVLVNVGILTEGANVPDTKTVLMARPTLSPVLYLQMIGRGARGPLTCAGKQTFNVVDCVDNFARHGLDLAGKIVAQALDAELHDELPSKRPISQERRQRAERAASVAAAALLVRGFEPAQYSFWGVLEWQAPGGVERAVGVFVETVQAVEEAVESIRRALTTGDWAGALHLTGSLDETGALRATDWNEIVSDARATGNAPTLTRIPELHVEAADDALAQALFRLSSVASEKPVPEVYSLCQQAWNEQEPLRDAYHHPSALAQELFSLLMKQAAPERTSSGELLTAYAQLGLAVAACDGRVDPSELHVLERSIQRVFPNIATDVALSQLEEPTDVSKPAALLDEQLGWHQRLVVFDYLFRIAIADGLFVSAEEHCLRHVGHLLGMAPEHVAERVRWSQAEVLVPTSGIAGFLTCRGCASTWKDDGATFFCGHCGTRLRGRSDASATTRPM